MNINKVKAYKNQKCHECGKLMNIMFRIVPKRARIIIKICPGCYFKIFK